MSEREGPPADAIGAGRAARLVGVTPSTIGRWINTGKLRGWRRAGRYLVSESEARALIVPVVPATNDGPRTRAEELAAAAQAEARLLKLKGYSVAGAK